jgi:hypothetical protein
MGGNARDLFFYKTIALEGVCEADISEESGAGFRSASLGFAVDRNQSEFGRVAKKPFKTVEQ